MKNFLGSDEVTESMSKSENLEAYKRKFVKLILLQREILPIEVQKQLAALGDQFD